MADVAVIRLKPYSYIHVLDNNTSVTRVEVGPQTFTRQDHEKVVFGPEVMVMIPPGNFAVIVNPVIRSEEGVAAVDDFGNFKLRHGDEEIRFEQEPFPLYPGEKLYGKVAPLQIIPPNAALRLRATRDYVDGKITRKAGDEWHLAGPGTYIPRVEVVVAEVVRATIIGPNQALKIRARKATVDSKGVARKAGEEWLVREIGAYIPSVDEENVSVVYAVILTEKKALHLRATRSFVDNLGKSRKAGAEWIVTSKESEAYIPDVCEEVVGEVRLTTLTSRNYAVVLDPIDAAGKQHFGQKELRRGPTSFFLQPGERLEAGIQNVYVLGDEEALLLRANEEFAEGGVKHLPGDRWMVRGPTDYVPPVEVSIVETRRLIALDVNEGVYVRDISTGKVRAVIGQSYMLTPYEELWDKELPKAVETLLTQMDPSYAGRERHRVVTVRAPHNTAMQIYDYKEKKSRVVFGPDLVVLGPDDQLTVLSLSGEKPKRPNVIKALTLQLGPDFMTDIITVETADHARLSLRLSYNWAFEFDKSNPEEKAKIFQVPDFVGDACKAVASCIRGAVAAVSFDNFHKESAKIIRTSVFGVDENGKVRSKLFFKSNCLSISNIDIQSVEPVDQRTRDSLQKSVQLAIEITTKSQEANARHEADRLEQEARGRLERQKINDESEAEKARKRLLELQAECASVESAGQATAEARARATAAHIEGEAAVTQARLRAEATRITSEALLSETKLRQKVEIDHSKDLDALEIHKATSLSEIEAKKFKDLVDSIGPNTITAIAQAGPEMQARLLKGLGLKSLLLTDGKSPINLFNTANSLIDSAAAVHASNSKGRYPEEEDESFA